MVAVLIVGAVLVVLNQTLLSPALPSIMDHMNVDETTVQWLTSAYSLTEAVVIPLAAWFMGRFSTRKLFLGCMTLFAAGSLVAATAPAFAVLLLGRVLQAMSTGVLMVMVMSLVLLTFPRESRGQAMGVVSLVIAFAPAVGPTAGGLLVDAVGWRALFCVVAVAAALVIAFAARALVNHDGFPRTAVDLPSVTLSVAGLAALLYGLSSFTSASNTVLCAALIVAGAVLVALFVRRQFSLDGPMLRLEVLRSRRYRTGFFVACVLQAILVGSGVLMPLYIQNVLGFNASVSGLTTLPGAVLGALLGLFAGRVFDRRGVRGIALIGTVALLAGSAGMFSYGIDTSLVLVIAANALMNIGLQMLFTPVNTWGVNSLDNELVQHATAVSNTMNQVGGSLGTALIMSFTAVGMQLSTQSDPTASMFSGYHLSFGVVLALAVVVLSIVVLFVRDKKGDAKPAAASATTTDADGVRHTVAEVMDAHPLTVAASSTADEAVRVLANADAGGAVVVDAGGAARGFLSNSDVLRFFGDELQAVSGASGFVAFRQMDDENVRDRVKRLAGIRVEDMATTPVVSVSPDVSFEEACRVLAEKRLKELPVVEDGRLVGTLHRRALLSVIARLLEEGSARKGA